MAKDYTLLIGPVGQGLNVSADGGESWTNIRPEIYEVFAITKLTKLFEIKDDEADALALM